VETDCMVFPKFDKAEDVYASQTGKHALFQHVPA